MLPRTSYCLLLVCCVSFFLLALALPFACAEERFTSNGDGTVTDAQTGLMWAKSDNNGNINWNQAQKWVKYTFPMTVETNYDDWRMPTVDELQTLFNKDGYAREVACGQKVKIHSAISISCGWLWSSEERTISARLFNFKRGYSYTDRKSKVKGYRVLPVRNAK